MWYLWIVVFWVIVIMNYIKLPILKIKNLLLMIEEKIKKLNLDYHTITELLFSKPFLTVSEFTEYM